MLNVNRQVMEEKDRTLHPSQAIVGRKDETIMCKMVGRSWRFQAPSSRGVGLSGNALEPIAARRVQGKRTVLRADDDVILKQL